MGLVLCLIISLSRLNLDKDIVFKVVCVIMNMGCDYYFGCMLLMIKKFENRIILGEKRKSLGLCD